MDTNIILIYIATGIVSFFIALFLVYSSTASARAKLKDKQKKTEGYMKLDVVADGAFKNAVFEEIKNEVISKQRCEEVSEKLADVFGKELEKRVELNNQKLEKKYSAVIDQKAKSEELAWGKYKKTLTEKRETEAVIHSIAEGLVVVDAGGKVVMMNPAAEKLLGVSRADKIGKPISENLQEEELLSLARGPSGGEDREIELVSAKDETKRVLRASSAVIENENGQTVGMVSMLSDITKQKELDRMKSHFVASISHELRTPLIAVQKALSLILSKATGPVSKTQEEFLSIADQNLKRLTNLINDLLDLSKLEAGKMELNREPCQVKKVINESIAGLNAWLQTKSINIEQRVEEGLPEINIDPNRIVQVLTNLLGNAIKFTPNGGGITVEASISDSKRAIEVSVKDTGIGIPKEDLPRLFNKFYQGSERGVSDISGTGIGLSIAKEIVELHEGKIWAESQKGPGAKFIFTLPLR